MSAPRVVGGGQDEEPTTLAALLPQLHEKLLTRKPRPCTVRLPVAQPCAPDAPDNDSPEERDLTPDLYDLAPNIPTFFWKRVGDLVAAHEKPRSHMAKSVDGSGNVDGSKWMSLRLDGHGFGKFLKVLRKERVLPEAGYSDVFGEVMQRICEELVRKFNGRFGYTQSDEITVLIPPTELKPVKAGGDAEYPPAPREHFGHDFNGRVQKTATLAASFATALFNRLLQKHVDSARAEKRRAGRGGAETTDESGTKNEDNDYPGDDLSLLATFDCRVGAYDSFEEAFALILWRCYDCGVNGVQDKVFQLKGPVHKLRQRCKAKKDAADPVLSKMAAEFEGLINKPVQLKLEWLLRFSDHGGVLESQDGKPLLPLPAHQAYGTFFQVVRRVRQGVNPKTGEHAPAKLKREIQRGKGGNLLAHFARGDLFVPDEVLGSY